jgi:hypothetical protein
VLRNLSNEFIYSPVDFENHLLKLEHKICELISGQDEDNQFINVEENAERIIITPKESSKICQLNLVEEIVKDLPPVDSDPKIDDTMIEFYIKYDEAYLQDQLPEGFLKTLFKFIEILDNDKMSGKVVYFNDTVAELFKQFKIINDLMGYKKNNVQDEKSKEDFTTSFIKYSKIFARKHFSGELPVNMSN